MKKQLTGALVFASLLLSACGQSRVNVQDGGKVIIRHDSRVYTKQDLFEDMKGQDYTALVVGKLATQIANKEGISAEELKKSVDTQIDAMKTLYKDNFQHIITNYGGEEKFKEIITRTFAQRKLLEKYLESNLEKYAKEFSPIKAQIAFFDTPELAQEVIDEVKNGANFAEVAKEKGYKLNADARVYTDKDKDVSLEVKSHFNDTKNNGLSQVTAKTSTIDKSGKKVDKERYYVVNILERDVHQFQKEFIALLQTKVPPNEALSYYFNQHELRFHDQRTYDLFAQSYRGIR